MVIKIIDVSYGKNKYWLHFNVFNGELDINRKFYIDFCGTDMDTNMSLTENQKETLKGNLTNDFGFAPYDLQKSKAIAKKVSSYVMRQPLGRIADEEKIEENN